MSTQQATYIAAKTAYEAAKAAARIEVGDMPDDIDDAGIEAFVAREIEAETRHNVIALQQAVRKAESELFAWAKSKLAALPQYAAKAAEIDKVFETRILSIREKAVRACLELAA